MSFENAIISFNTDPYKWIEDGIQIAERVNPSALKSKRSAQSDGDRDSAGANFYGYKPSSSLSFDEQMDRYVGLGQYYNLDVLRAVETYLDNINQFIDLGGNLEKAKIKYSSIPRGIFDFNKASRGLIRPVEYYCEELNKLIEPNLVRLKNLNGKEENFYTHNDEELYCEARQEGTTKLLKAYPSQLKKEFLRSNKIYIPVDLEGKRVTKLGDLRLRFTSTEKKVYAYRETLGGGVAPYVDLFVHQGGNAGVKGEGMFIQAMPLIMLANILEQAGVKTRIWTADYYRAGEINPIAHHLLIKEYGESYDTNKMGLFTSDPRIFRYLGWNALLGQNYRITEANNKINSDIKVQDDLWGGKGSSFSPSRIMKDFPIYKNFYDSYQKEGLIPTSQVSKDLMIFSGTDLDNVGTPRFFNDDGSLNEGVKNAIFESFYQVADYVSLKLSKTPKRVLAGISNRLEEEGFSPQDRDLYFGKFYNTITNNISYTRPNSSDNINLIRGSSTIEEINEGREKRLEMAELLNEFIVSNNLKITP